MRDHLFEKCQTLAPNLHSGVDAHTSDVSARPCQIRHDAAGYWITHGGDNGNRACCFLEPRDKPCRKDHVGLLGNGLMCDCCKSVFISLGSVSAHHQVLPLDVSEATQFLEEGSNKGIAARFRDLDDWDCWEDDRNAIRFARLLADGKLHRPEKQQASEEPSLHHMWHGPVPPHSVNLCK